MNVLILGAAGFIGTNLSLKLIQNGLDTITLVDKKKSFFSPAVLAHEGDKIHIIGTEIGMQTDFDDLLKGQDIIYHLMSSTVPTTSNQHIQEELNANIVMTAGLLDACVHNGVKRVIFLSSGGTVYGKVEEYPIKEEHSQYPISAYGLQKLTIEKLLYLYNYIYDIDYRVVRLSNPYGPYQKPNGVQGVVTTFVNNVLFDKPIVVYGDGTVIRDFIYIDDAVEGIIRIANSNSEHKLFNLGCGYGTSVNQVIDSLKKVLNKEFEATYVAARQVDVPVNYLDISLFEKEIGKLEFTDLEEGIRRTAVFLEQNIGV